MRTNVLITPFREECHEIAFSWQEMTIICHCAGSHPEAGFPAAPPTRQNGEGRNRRRRARPNRPLRTADYRRFPPRAGGSGARKGPAAAQPRPPGRQRGAGAQVAPPAAAGASIRMRPRPARGARGAHPTRRCAPTIRRTATCGCALKGKSEQMVRMRSLHATRDSGVDRRLLQEPTAPRHRAKRWLAAV